MTNQYLTAFANDPIIRGAIMQSADSVFLFDLFAFLLSLTTHHVASQPMWPLNSQLDMVAGNISCPVGGRDGQLDCLRSKSGFELQKVLLATGAQFQPVTDNITIFKE